MIQAGLVLEGGGMKGVYTAGVLDFFLERGLYFANCYGVSAGAIHLCSYISKQHKRAYRASMNYLDGAMADSIPIRRSIADGNQKNVVILTKEIGFVRKPSSHIGLMKLRYKKYPKVYELMANRHNMYNDTLAFIEEEEKAGRAFVIRPQVAGNVGRIEKDRAKLEALYQTGYEDAKNCYESLIVFLGK